MEISKEKRIKNLEKFRNWCIKQYPHYKTLFERAAFNDLKKIVKV